MLNKALIAAAAVSILSAGLISSAEAASDFVTVRDHRPPEVRDRRTKTENRDYRTKVDVRDHRAKEQVRDHRPERRNEVVKANGPKIGCSLGHEKLWWGGYKSVEATNCQGADYSYRAIKGEGVFQASMNAYDGKMTVIFVGSTR